MLLTTGNASGASGASGPCTAFSWCLNQNESPAAVLVREDLPPSATRRKEGCLPAGVTLAPGMTDAPENFGVVRYVVPQSRHDKVRIETEARTVAVGEPAGDSDFQVLTNGVLVFGLLLAPHTAAGYTNEMSLGPGDTVDFVVGKGWDQMHAGSLVTVAARFSTVPK